MYYLSLQKNDKPTFIRTWKVKWGVKFRVPAADQQQHCCFNTNLKSNSAELKLPLLITISGYQPNQFFNNIVICFRRICESQMDGF